MKDVGPCGSDVSPCPCP